ncbi:MAG: hypothetical protein PHS49_02205 [Candidatus Gracilibacteria bacterium]|nr:hypothetical protein [Candidatus Gracilibacteria bacterium]
MMDEINWSFLLGMVIVIFVVSYWKEKDLVTGTMRGAFISVVAMAIMLSVQIFV